MNNFPGANYRSQMDEIAEVVLYQPKIVQCIQCFNEEEFIELVEEQGEYCYGRM